jgi:hypothetical protein
MFTCVCPNMSLKKPRPREALSAEVAFAALIVSPEVHRVGRHRDVRLAAVRALASLLVFEGPEKDKTLRLG